MASPPAGRTQHTKKIAGAPDYDDAAFWDTKFATGQDVGEWLTSGEELVEAVLADLERRPLPGGLEAARRPRVLHLGPGVSKLGTKLRDAFVRRGWMGNGIVNVDFSAEAVRLGQELESGQSQAMHWVQADLRSWTDTSANLTRFAPFDVILDKSTSDAIATSEPQIFPSPAGAASGSICPTVREIVDQHGTLSLSPVELLALHLVPLTQPGTTWIALSYSASRFDGLPRLAAHWDLVSRTALPAPSGETSSAAAHTPQVFHWIYVLRRR
ncbi:hypothetical protein VTN02DRAFT_2804 [Thermoascus thermophilus]